MRDSIARFLYRRPLAVPPNSPAARDHRELELTDRRLLLWWALLLLFYFTRGALGDVGVRAAPLVVVVVVVVSLREVASK